MEKGRRDIWREEIWNLERVITGNVNLRMANVVPAYRKPVSRVNRGRDVDEFIGLKGSMPHDINGTVFGFSECENVGGGCGGDLTRSVHDRGVHTLDVECRETKSVGA